MHRHMEKLFEENNIPMTERNLKLVRFHNADIRREFSDLCHQFLERRKFETYPQHVWGFQVALFYNFLERQQTKEKFKDLHERYEGSLDDKR